MRALQLSVSLTVRPVENVQSSILTAWSATMQRDLIAHSLSQLEILYRMVLLAFINSKTIVSKQSHTCL